MSHCVVLHGLASLYCKPIRHAGHPGAHLQVQGQHLCGAVWVSQFQSSPSSPPRALGPGGGRYFSFSLSLSLSPPPPPFFGSRLDLAVGALSPLLPRIYICLSLSLSPPPSPPLCLTPALMFRSFRAPSRVRAKLWPCRYMSLQLATTSPTTTALASACKRARSSPARPATRRGPTCQPLCVRGRCCPDSSPCLIGPEPRTPPHVAPPIRCHYMCASRREIRVQFELKVKLAPRAPCARRFTGVLPGFARSCPVLPAC